MTSTQEIRRRFMAALEAGLGQAEAERVANGKASMPRLPDAPAPSAPPGLAGKIAAMNDHLPALRARYTELMGKKPFGGWDAATLREKIIAAERAA